MPTRDDYRIGWICALPVEMAAAQAMLDRFHPPLPNRKNDSNKYVLGSIGPHNIVISCLPAGVYGTTSATATVLRMRDSYESLEVCFMVGIGGGAPDDHDIRLGDIVVSEPTTQYGGVMQYDRGKAVDGGRTAPTGVLNKPPDAILRALQGLKAEHFLRSNDVCRLSNEAMGKYPLLRARAQHPGRDADQLFVAEYSHVSSGSNCDGCNPKMLRQRLPRQDDHPRIFYGLIASGNKVIKEAEVRDQLAKQYGILCFETEAAGIMDIFPCLVIRGVCDYSDSHKNKRWQGYAAVVAAAYAKEFLLHLPSRDMVNTPATVEKVDSKPQLPNLDELTVSDSSFSPFAPSTQSRPCQNQSAPTPNPPILGSDLVEPDVSPRRSGSPSGSGSDDDSTHAVDVTEHESKFFSQSEAASDDVEAAALVQPSTGEYGKHQHTSSSGFKSSCQEIEVAPHSPRPMPSDLASHINSQVIFQKNLTLSRTRKAWHPWPGDCDKVFHSLNAWLSTTSFQGLIVSLETRGTSMMPGHTRETGFAAEVIDFLLQWRKAQAPHDSHYQVVWALPSATAASNGPVETLKSIISDLIRLYPDVTPPDEISNAPHSTERDLWLLFETMLARAKRTFVVFHSNNLDLTSRMLQFANHSIIRPGYPIKIMIVVSNKDVVTDLNRYHDRWRLVHIPQEPPVSARLRRRPVGRMGWHLLCPRF